MRRIAIVLAFLAVLANGAHALDADDILAKVDARRAVAPSFRFQIKIDDYEKGLLVQSATMTGNVKGMDRTLVQYEEPANMRGKKLLMIDGETFFFVPKTKRPVRLTASQRLMGQASNSDVMNVRFQSDYLPRIAGDETVETEGGPVPCLIVELTAKRSSAAYGAMTLWVDRKEYFPVKAECFAASGKLLKTAEYSRIREFEGKKIVTRATLHDKVSRDTCTVIDFLDMAEADIPDAFFTKEFLSRM